MSDFDIKLPDGRVLKQSLIKNSIEYQNEILALKAKFNTPPQCLCNTEFENKLVIKQRGSKIFLAAWPGSGCMHNMICQHYNEAPDGLTGKSLITKGAKIEKLGRVYISCLVTLTHREKAESSSNGASNAGAEKEPKEGKEAGETEGKRKIGLLELFYEFWMGAQLHQHAPGAEARRNWVHIRDKIADFTRNIYVNKVSMAEGLYIPFAFSKEHIEKIEKEKEKFFQPWRGEKNKDLLVIGELKDIEQNDHGWTVKLRHESYPLYMTEQQFETMRSHFKFPVSIFEEKQRSGRDIGKIMIIAACNMPSKYLTVRSIAMVGVSHEYIPASSMNELKLIHKLIGEKRSFFRPAKFLLDSTDTADYVLVDTPSETMLAIYDSEVPEYDSYKNTKMLNLKSLKYNTWNWFPGEASEIPELPQPFIPESAEA